MDKSWQRIARRIVEGLGVRPGELIDLRDDSGQMRVALETCLAIERAGATPLLQLLPAEQLERIWAEVPHEHLANWDLHRQKWMKQVDRVLVLGGARPDVGSVPGDVVHTWEQAQNRLSVIEEERRLPYLVVAVPTERRAKQLGLTYETLEQILLPALGASVEELQQEISRALAKAGSGQAITIHSGEDHILHLQHGDRTWLSDDGYIDDADRSRGAIVSNLPAGSVYTTVMEDQTHGSLWLPRAGEATGVVFHFEDGRIVEIEAASGAELLSRELDEHSGEPGRVSHIGIGLNPHLEQPTGWTIVDEHIRGHLFLALGENRYMGGHNESSLNRDYALANATLRVDGQSIVSEGKLIP